METPGWSLSVLGIAYAVAFLVLGALDAVWLGWISKDLYRNEMGALMATSPRLLPAAIFYLAYPFAIVWFGLSTAPLPESSSLASAFIRCAALGLMAYGTYDLTNMSVIKGFSVKLALIDMAWGTFASGVAGMAAKAAMRWWTSRG